MRVGGSHYATVDRNRSLGFFYCSQFQLQKLFLTVFREILLSFEFNFKMYILNADCEITALVFIADKIFVCGAGQCIEKLHFVITI